MEHRMAFVNEVEKHLKKELAGFDPLVYKVPGRPTISPKYHRNSSFLNIFFILSNLHKICWLGIYIPPICMVG